MVSKVNSSSHERKNLEGPPIEKEKSRWKTSTKAVLIVGAVSLVAAAIFYSYLTLSHPGPIELNWSEEQELKNSLKDVCKDAVNKFCKKGLDGKEVCLRDYLSPNWEPHISFEHRRDILCPVSLKSDNCSSLVGQPSVEEWLKGEWSFVFRKNYEGIPAVIPESLSNRFKAFIAENCSDWDPITKMIDFKSHIFCSGP